VRPRERGCAKRVAAFLVGPAAEGSYNGLAPKRGANKPDHLLRVPIFGGHWRPYLDQAFARPPYVPPTAGFRALVILRWTDRPDITMHSTVGCDTCVLPAHYCSVYVLRGTRRDAARQTVDLSPDERPPSQGVAKPASA